MDSQLIKKIYNLGYDLRQARSLNRALIDCMENNYNFKNFDAENLARILSTLLDKLITDFNIIDKIIVNISREMNNQNYNKKA